MPAHNYVPNDGLLRREWKIRRYSGDPLIEGVAIKQIPLTIHPNVYLLVYGFDPDQTQGAVKKRLDELRDILGNRVIAKGDPSRFTLSKDIISLEAAAS